MARIVTPSGIRPGAPGVRPGPQKRTSAFDTTRTTSPAFKRFEKSVRACTHKSSSSVRFRAKGTLEPTSPNDRV
jgi:hypothetical protein